MTIISMTRSTQDLPGIISNWKDTPTHVQEFLLQADTVAFTFNEMLVYKGRKLIASCTCEGGEADTEILDCWTPEGNKW